MQELECIEINSKSKAEACIIWLHGLGADGEDFVPMVDRLNIPNKKNVKFVFPSALFRSISINNGISMRGWYDIIDIHINKKEDDFGIKQSHNIISRLITKQINLGIPANKIIIGGFSQGAGMSLYTGLRFKQALGGIVAFSGYCPKIDCLKDEASIENQNTNIFQTHGLFDPVVPLHVGKSTYDKLTQLNYNVEFKTYPMQHTVSDQEIRDLSDVLTKMLNFASVK